MCIFLQVFDFYGFDLRPILDNLTQQGDAIHFLNEAFRHCKAIAATGEGVELLQASSIRGVDVSEEQLKSDQGVVTIGNTSDMQSFKMGRLTRRIPLL